MSVCRGLEGGENAECLLSGYEGDEELLELERGGGGTTEL